jgi:hypothetical protein
MSDLQRRLQAIPSELDDLYGHMLSRIEPMYLEQASKIFQIVNAATDLTLQLSVLELELAVSSTFAQAREPPGNPMGDKEIESRCLRMRAALKSRCEGLLETHDHMDRHWESVDEQFHLRRLFRLREHLIKRGERLLTLPSFRHQKSTQECPCRRQEADDRLEGVLPAPYCQRLPTIRCCSSQTPKSGLFSGSLLAKLITSAILYY